LCGEVDRAQRAAISNGSGERLADEGIDVTLQFVGAGDAEAAYREKPGP